MSVIDDYRNMGGLKGIAESLLRQQLKEAAEEPAHLLADVAEALSQGNSERAAECLMQTLSELPERHPLEAVKTVFYTLPAVQAGHCAAIEFAAFGVFPDDFPPILAAWGAIGADRRARNTHAAKQPRGEKPGREAMIEAMAKAKRNGRSLKEFKQAVEAGSIDGLQFRPPQTYFFDRHGDGDAEYTAGDDALAKCWTEARSRRTKIGS